MSSVNKVILIGNLGKDPEIRSTQDGREIANFTLATSESWKDKLSGESKEKTEWHKIVVFQAGLVDIVKKYIKKGSKLFVEGSLQTRKWQDKSGVEKYTTEVVIQGFNGKIEMLGGKAQAQNVEQAENSTSDCKAEDYAEATQSVGSDEIPF